LFATHVQLHADKSKLDTKPAGQNKLFQVLQRPAFLSPVKQVVDLLCSAVQLTAQAVGMAGKSMLAALMCRYQEIPLLYPLTRNIQGSKRPPQLLSRDTLSYRSPSHDSQWQVHMKVGKHGTIMV